MNRLLKCQSLVLIVLCALAACSGAGSPGSPPDNRLNVLASLGQLNGGISSGSVSLSRGTEKAPVTDVVGVTMFGNTLDWNATFQEYQKTTGWSPLYVNEGQSVSFLVTLSSETVSATLQMPSRIVNRANDPVVNHPINTPLTITWEPSSSQYAVVPQNVYVSIYVVKPYFSNAYEIPLSTGTFTLPGSLFPTSGSNFYIWVGTDVQTTDLGSNVNPSTSVFRLAQAENALYGNTK